LHCTKTRRRPFSLEIIEGIRSNDIPAVEQRFRAVARLPKVYSHTFLGRGSIYPEIDALIKEKRDDLIVAVVDIARRYQLSTLPLDLCQAASLLQLSLENPSKAFLDALQRIVQSSPDYETTLKNLIAESRYPLDEHFLALEKFILDHRE
jgi:hypothetical protein